MTKYPCSEISLKSFVMLLERIKNISNTLQETILNFLLINNLSNAQKEYIKSLCGDDLTYYKIISTLTTDKIQEPTNAGDVSEFCGKLFENLYNGATDFKTIYNLMTAQQQSEFLTILKDYEDFATMLYKDDKSLSDIVGTDSNNIAKVREALYKYYEIDSPELSAPDNNKGSNIKLDSTDNVADTTLDNNTVIDSSKDNIGSTNIDKQSALNKILKDFSKEYKLTGLCPLYAMYLVQDPASKKLHLMLLKTMNSGMIKTNIVFDNLTDFYNVYKSSETVLLDKVIDLNSQKVLQESIPLNSVCNKIFLVTNSKTIAVTPNNVSTLEKEIDTNNFLSYAELAQIASDNNLDDYTESDSDITLRFYKLMDQITNVQNQEKITATTNEALKQDLEKKQETIKKLLQNTEKMQKYENHLQDQLKSCQDLSMLLRSALNSEYVKDKSKASTEEVRAFGKEFNLESDPGWTTRASNAINKSYLSPDTVTNHKIVLPYNA